MRDGADDALGEQARRVAHRIRRNVSPQPLMDDDCAELLGRDFEQAGQVAEALVDRAAGCHLLAVGDALHGCGKRGRCGIDRAL